MMPAFRDSVLSLAGNAIKETHAPENNVVAQLQLLFACLQQTDSASVSPREFCYALKDFDGQPTDMLVQQDASEFLTTFFQQVSE
jgi:ubiquitin C-terminal hydrolase